MWKTAFLAGVSAVLILSPATSRAAIHEIVAAYCSGGDVGVIGSDGMLEPPGVTTPGKNSFRRPATASGAVSAGQTTDKENVKYPEGLPAGSLEAEDANHPSAEHREALAF